MVDGVTIEVDTCMIQKQELIVYAHTLHTYIHCYSHPWLLTVKGVPTAAMPMVAMHATTMFIVAMSMMYCCCTDCCYVFYQHVHCCYGF